MNAYKMLMSLIALISDTKLRSLIKAALKMYLESAYPAGSPKVASVDAIVAENNDLRKQVEEKATRQLQLFEENKVYKKALEEAKLQREGDKEDLRNLLLKVSKLHDDAENQLYCQERQNRQLRDTQETLRVYTDKNAELQRLFDELKKEDERADKLHRQELQVALDAVIKEQRKNHAYEVGIEDLRRENADQGRQIVDLRNAHASLLEKEAYLRRTVAFSLKQKTVGDIQLNLARLCLCWYYRNDTKSLNSLSVEELHRRAEQVMDGITDSRASDDVCSVSTYYRRLVDVLM